MTNRSSTSKKTQSRRKSTRSHARRQTSRARARRRPARSATGDRRRDDNLVEIRTNVGQATEHLRRASRDIAEAGGAGAELVLEVAEEATERAGEAVETVRERAGDAASAVAEGAQRAAVTAGRTAVGVTTQAPNLPELVREGARRGLELVEEVGTRLAASVLDVGSRALNAAADYVNEIAPRRRVRRQALEQLVLEQIAWAQCGTDTLERAAGDVDDDGLRVQLVRSKLQTIRHAETLAQVLGQLGGRMRQPEQMPRVRPARVEGAGHPGDGRVRHDLESALSCAVQQAEGWRALAQIAAGAESESVSSALGRACEAVGREPDEQVEILREAAMRRTVDTVLV